jgi:lambda family phage portal protein
VAGDLTLPWFDRVLLRWSPQRALRRAQARAATQAVSRLTRGYDAASRSRRTEGWLTAGGASANAELRWQLRTLRDRSRDHCRNNAYGRRAVRRLTSSIVGYGILGTITGPNQRKAAKLTDLWKQWTCGTGCDQRGRQTFAGLQRLACRTWFESGECLIRRTWGKGDPSPMTLQLQVLEPDYLDDFKQTIGIPPTAPKGENRLNQGVELDADDRPVAYWLYPYHPGDAATVAGAAAPAAFQIPPYGSSQRVDAKDITHLFYEERAGQCRGVPLLSTVTLKLRDLDEYEDAHLIRQKIAACFAVFLTQPEGIPPPPSATSEPPGICERVEPGMVENLPAGWEVNMASPPGVEGYDEFMWRQLAGVASGTDIPYEELSGDYSRVNFSSARMARGAYHELIDELQWTVFVPQFCDRVWSWFREAAQMAGVPGAADARITWTVPRKMLVDPAREIPATIREVRAGLTSPQEAIRELGNDPEQVLDEWENFTKDLDRRALVLDMDPRRVAPAGNPVVPPAAGPDLTEEQPEQPAPPVAGTNGKGTPDPAP